jgi:cephalosporin-C deacetylase
MPLEQLQRYTGRNPQPEDLDQYWTDALAEMEQVTSNIRIEPSLFTAACAECSHLYFTGVGGSRIHAKLLRPKNHAGSRPAVVAFHGYTGNAGSWHQHLPYAAEGFVVAALDCRGQGGSSEDRSAIRGNTHHGHIIRGLDDTPEKLLYRQIFLDTVQLTRIIMDMDDVDPHRVAATGASQGGGLTLACASLEPRIARVAPVYPFLSDYQRVWEMDLAKGAYEELRQFFRHFDPTHSREQEIFTRLGYIDVHNLAPRIKGEVMMLTGLMDVICPPSTQFAAYNRITAKKQMVIYPDFGHEGLPYADDRIFTFLRDL